MNRAKIATEHVLSRDQVEFEKKNVQFFSVILYTSTSSTHRGQGFTTENFHEKLPRV